MLNFLLGASLTALAADEPAAELGATLLSRQEALHAPLLVCAAGAEAEERATKALRDHPGVDIQIVRVPTQGDTAAEVQRALTTAGLRCALRLTAAADGPFTLDSFGDCSPSPAEGEAAVALAPVVDAAAWKEREARYQIEKLQIVDRKPDPQSFDQSRWLVANGAGATVSGRRLAELTRDEETLARMRAESAAAAKKSTIIRWTGIGLLALSPAPLLFMKSGAVDQNRDKGMTTLVLAGMGGITLGLSPYPRKAVVSAQAQASRYYKVSTAEELTAAHNQALYNRLELGLAPKPAADSGQITVIMPGMPAPEAAPATTPAAPTAAPEAAPAVPSPATPTAPAPVVPAPAAPAPVAPAPAPAAPAPVAPAPAPAAPAPVAPAPAPAAPAAPAPAPASPTAPASPAPAEAAPPAAPAPAGGAL
jgi:hypothetical protein